MGTIHRGSADEPTSLEFRAQMHKGVKLRSGEWLGKHVAEPVTSRKKEPPSKVTRAGRIAAANKVMVKYGQPTYKA